MEFKFSNVERGTFGKTLPLLQNILIRLSFCGIRMTNDHVFFVALSQLISWLKQMKADHWSIVFWSEGSSGTGNDKNMSGPSAYQNPVVSNLPSGKIKFQYGPRGNSSPHYPEGGSSTLVPENNFI